MADVDPSAYQVITMLKGIVDENDIAKFSEEAFVGSSPSLQPYSAKTV